MKDKHILVEDGLVRVRMIATSGLIPLPFRGFHIKTLLRRTRCDIYVIPSNENFFFFAHTQSLGINRKTVENQKSFISFIS